MTDKEVEFLREMTRQNELNRGCGPAAGYMAVLALLVLVLLSGCRTKEVAMTSQHTVHDTTYVVKVMRDSVWIETTKQDSVVIREKGDTVWVERWKIEYRDRWHDYLQVDTVHDAYVEKDTVVVVETRGDAKLSLRKRLKEQAKGAFFCAAVFTGIWWTLLLRRYRGKG